MIAVGTHPITVLARAIRKRAKRISPRILMIVIGYLEFPTILISEGSETNTPMALAPDINTVVLKSKDWEFRVEQHGTKWER
jgi:hypothetical protein